MDSLKRRVRERDLKHNTDRQMRATERDVETKRICLECRRVPDALAMRMDWYQKNRDEWGYQKVPWPGVGDVCPACGGKLIEVSW